MSEVTCEIKMQVNSYLHKIVITLKIQAANHSSFTELCQMIQIDCLVKPKSGIFRNCLEEQKGSREKLSAYYCVKELSEIQANSANYRSSQNEMEFP